MDMTSVLGSVDDYSQRLDSRWRAPDGIVHHVNEQRLDQTLGGTGYEFIVMGWETACWVEYWEERPPDMTDEAATCLACLAASPEDV